MSDQNQGPGSPNGSNGTSATDLSVDSWGDYSAPFVDNTTPNCVTELPFPADELPLGLQTHFDGQWMIGHRHNKEWAPCNFPLAPHQLAVNTPTGVEHWFNRLCHDGFCRLGDGSFVDEHHRCHPMQTHPSCTQHWSTSTPPWHGSHCGLWQSHPHPPPDHFDATPVTP